MMNPEMFLQLVSIRQMVGPATPGEVHKHMGEFAKLREGHIAAMGGLQGGSPRILELLRENKVGFEQNTGRTPSRPSLCAKIISDLTEGYESRAISALEKDDEAGFRFNHDVAFGLGVPAAALTAAEEEIRGDFESGIVGIIPMVEDVVHGEESAGRESDAFLAHMRNAREMAQTLKEDPTGVALLNMWVERIRTSPHAIHPSQSKEYVIVGAELARDLYQGLYQTAEPLYSTD